MSTLSKDHLLRYKVIKEIVTEYPEMSETLNKYFGEDCLKRQGFKIQTLEMACILSGVDQIRLIRDFEKVKVERHE
jgi:hypothetical protein